MLETRLLLVAAFALLVTFGVPSLGIWAARKRKRVGATSKVQFVFACIWAALTLLSAITDPTNLLKLSQAAVSGYWLYAANEANRSSGSSWHLF